MNKILVIGPGSLTGSRFIELLKDSYEIYGAGGGMDEGDGLVSFEKLDITNNENIDKVIGRFPGEFVINFAGATLVDEIEKTRPTDPNNQDELDQNLAYRVNVLGTRNLVQASKKYNKFPIFISTGFVFDGKNGPYNEDDPLAASPEDVSWYAWTKILAEKEVEQSVNKCLTIRICYPYRSEYPGKLDFGRNLLQVSTKYPIFADQTLTPTLIDDIPEAVVFLLGKGESGIFHVTSPEVTTPFEFCLELLRVVRGETNPEKLVKKGSIVEFQNLNPKVAKRPVHGGEKSDKMIKRGFTPTSWREGIRKAYG